MLLLRGQDASCITDEDSVNIPNFSLYLSFAKGGESMLQLTAFSDTCSTSFTASRQFQKQSTNSHELCINLIYTGKQWENGP